MKRYRIVRKLKWIDQDITANQGIIRSYIKAGAFFTTGQRMVRHEGMARLACQYEYDLAEGV